MTPEIKQRIEQIRQGEIPEEYQKKSVGIIPKNWNKSFLGAIIKELSSGVSVNSDVTIDTGVYVLKTSSVSEGKVNLRESKPIIPGDLKRVRCPVLQGTILISRMNTPILVGECGYVNEGSDIHYLPDRLWQAINRSEKICNFKWLSYLLNSDRYRTAIHALGTGTSNSMKNISKEDFLTLPIAFPPLLEQQKIADILTTQDKVIELKEKHLTEKQRQKKYLMQQLLTGKKRLPGFSGEWKADRLGKLFFERKETNCEGLEMLAITGTQGIIPRKDLDLKDNSSEDKSKYLRVCVGDIGYNTMRMWQGVSAYSNYEGIVSPAYTILKPSSSINAKYFAYLFKMPETIFLFYRFSQGLVDDTRNLKYENFKKIKVFYPPDVKEQTAIAGVLSAADREIELLRQDIELEKQKKKALMQLLLTGIVRV